MADILDDKAGTLPYQAVVEYRITVLRRDANGKEAMLVDRKIVCDLRRVKGVTTHLYNRSLKALRRHEFTVVAGYYGKLSDEPYRMAYGIIIGDKGYTRQCYGGFDPEDEAQDQGERKRNRPWTVDSNRGRKKVGEDA
jgi:hypothetical protein